MKTQKSQVKGFFRTFPQIKKSAKLGSHSSPRVPASVRPSTLEAQLEVAPVPDSVEWVQLGDGDTGKVYCWNMRINSAVWKVSRSSGSVPRMGEGSVTTGRGAPVSVGSTSLLCHLGEASRGEGLASPHPFLGATLEPLDRCHCVVGSIFLGPAVVLYMRQSTWLLVGPVSVFSPKLRCWVHLLRQLTEFLWTLFTAPCVWRLVVPFPFGMPQLLCIWWSMSLLFLLLPCRDAEAVSMVQTALRTLSLAVAPGQGCQCPYCAGRSGRAGRLLPVVAQRRLPMVFQTIQTPQLPWIWWSMFLLFWSCEFHSRRLWRRQSCSHSCSSLSFARGRRHSCRDAVAVSHGQHCLADHRVSPVALQQGCRCPFLCRSSDFLRYCRGGDSRAPVCSSLHAA